MSLISFSCKLTKLDSKIAEPYRPAYHFTPDSMWMNDPNGMVFYKGEYHLFYQYHPESTVWGPMHWGHAVSKDLIQWTDMPIALYPDSLGYIFSGSVVVDWNNTSGLGSLSNPPLVAIFTHHDMKGEKAGRSDYQTQSIAYSIDNGTTWTKYKNNPVIKNPGVKDFRDPKVIWHPNANKWIMALAVYDKVQFYGSTDLKKWEYLSSFGIKGDDRLWECPDLFPIRVKNSDIIKWALIVSMQQKAPNGGTGTSYWIGDFDGQVFTGAKGKEDQQWLDYGTDNYALVTFSNVGKRKVALGWMSNWQYAQDVPSKKWRSAMTLPRELTLIKSEVKYKLLSKPVMEADSMIIKKEKINAQKVINSLSISKGNLPTKITQSLTKPTSGSFYYRLSNKKGDFLLVGYKAYANQWFIDRTKAGNVTFNAKFPGIHYAGDPLPNKPSTDLELWIDNSSVELFVDGGRLAMTDIFFVETPFDKIELIVDRPEGLVIQEGTLGFR